VSGLETAFLRAGGVVVKHVATAWLSRKKTENRRGAELTELIALRFGGLRERDQRVLRRKLEEVGELAGERLEELCAREFADLADNERLAALDAVVDALDDADLSDTTFLGADLNPMAIAKEVKRQVPGASGRAGLDESARALFDRALDLCCLQLVHLVRQLPEFNSRLSEESLRRATSILAGVEEILNRLPTTSLDAPAGTDHDDHFRHRYLDLTAKHYDDLELIGVSVRSFRPKTKLSVAYLSLSVSGGQIRIDDAHHEPEFAPYHSGALRVETALGGSERILVRGEAGCGKSTLLRWIAVQSARGRLGASLASWNGRIPILLKLRSYAGSPLPKPEHFLDEPTGPLLGPVPDGWTHRQLVAGRVLLLVDGVDELTKGERPKVRRWLDKLLKSYPSTQIVVTSRPAAAGVKWLADEGFTTVDLEHMTQSDIQDFVQRWHDALLAAGSGALPFGRAEVEARQRGLQSKLDARGDLRNLVRSPLMCAMVCALNLDRSGDLPRDRKSLYEAALEMVLDRRETERDIPVAGEIALGYREKLTLLQDLAFWLNLNGRSEIDRETAVERVARKLASMPGVGSDAVSCLNHLLERSGVIREPVEGRIDFVHRTFQEFLAAREAAEDGHVGLLVEKSRSDQWRETVIMAAGLLNRPGRAELLTGILGRADAAKGKYSRKLRLLAATCCESVHELPADVLAKVDGCVGTLVPPRSTAESRSLSTVGESILDSLPTEIGHLPAPQAAACAYTAALVNGPRALRLLQGYAEDSRVEVQDELIEAWPYFNPEEYARTVLIDAPLHNGEVVVDDVRVLPHLPALKNLSKVHLSLNTLGPLDLDFIEPDWKVGTLDATASGDITLPAPEQVPSLTYLQVIPKGRVRNIDALGRFPELTTLSLYPDQAVRDIAFLAGIPRVQELYLDRLAHDADPSPFSALTNLRILGLFNDEPVPALRKIPKPGQLRQISTYVETKSEIQFVINRFPNLTRLYLPGARTLRGIDFSPLQELELLSASRLSDHASLAQLGVLSKLARLYLLRTGNVDLRALTNDDLTIRVESGTTVSGIANRETVRIERSRLAAPERNRKGRRARYYR
jgi:hypothetical protein